MTKSVMKLLEENRQTVKSLAKPDAMIDDRPVTDLVEEILARDPWKNLRASKMDLDQFLQLLTEFNEAGIHFSC